MEINILIISHNSFSNKTNNGKTLESIFSKFDKKNLFQIFFRLIEEIDYEYCENYLYVSPFRNLINPTYFDRPSNSYSNNFFSFLKDKFNGAVKYLVNDIFWAIFFKGTPGVLDWVTGNNIKAIFFLAGPSGFSHNLAVEISRKLNIPMFVYFTDDYLIFPLRSNLFDKIQYLRLSRIFSKTISQSHLNFAIGIEMCQQYNKFFGKNFLPLMNSFTILKFDEPEDKTENLVISYFGSLHSFRWKNLIKFSQFIQRINSSNTNSFTLNVFTNTNLDDKIRLELECFNTNIFDPVYGESYLNAIKRSDLLLHCESDDDYFSSKTKLSISTKIPEYCLSNRPIIAFGPTNIASFKILIENQIAFVIDSTDDDNSILNQLNKVFDFKVRLNFVRRAFNYGKSNHDIRVISENFKNTILNELKYFYGKDYK